jgi:precorrin-2 dehydrogenase/sirohydrochlorin ferrochelatase
MDVIYLDKWYPIHLDITDRKCVVIGGGRIALRRVQGLLNAGAQVTVISPDCHPDILLLAEEGAIQYVQHNYRGVEQLAHADLIFAATNDGVINEQIANDARMLRIPMNHSGNSKLSTLIVPAVIRRGKLILSVSTSGASPGLTKRIRSELSEQYGDEYAIYVDFLSELREFVIENVENEQFRANIFHHVLKFDILELIRTNQLHVFRSWLQLIVEQELHIVEGQQQFYTYVNSL